MANPVSVGYEFKGDASSFVKAAKNAKAAASEMKQNLGDLDGALNELSGTFGDVGGGIANTISQIAKANGPIGILTAAVALLAMAWKRSKENMELYLKSADKLAVGPAAFQTDVTQARKDTKRRASGEIAEGLKQIEYAERQLSLRKNLTEEQISFLESLKESGEEMMKQGQALYDQVSGMNLQGKVTRNKLDWEVKYNALLQEQEKLQDESLANETRWEEMEAKLAEARQVIRDATSTIAEKTKAIADGESVAAQLAKEKIPFLDQQIKNVRELSEMTATQEVVEEKIANLEKLKATAQKEYALDMTQILRMQNQSARESERIAGSEEKKLKALKQQNILNSDAISLAKADPFSYKIGRQTIVPYGKAVMPGLSGSPSLPESFDALDESMGRTMDAVYQMESAFASMFSNISGGFKGMAESLMQEINRIAVQLAAKAAVFGILKVLFPGTFIDMGLYQTGSFGRFLGIPGYASGTNFAPGGLSLVGERGPELVNLPRGSQVVPMKNQKIIIEGRTRISGRDLEIVLRRNGI